MQQRYHLSAHATPAHSHAQSLSPETLSLPPTPSEIDHWLPAADREFEEPSMSADPNTKSQMDAMSGWILKKSEHPSKTGMGMGMLSTLSRYDRRFMTLDAPTQALRCFKSEQFR